MMQVISTLSMRVDKHPDAGHHLHHATHAAVVHQVILGAVHQVITDSDILMQVISSP